MELLWWRQVLVTVYGVLDYLPAIGKLSIGNTGVAPTGLGRFSQKRGKSWQPVIAKLVEKGSTLNIEYTVSMYYNEATEMPVLPS